MIQYRFLNATKMIQSSESARIYPSVRLRLRRQGMTKESCFSSSKEKGGLEECKHKSYLPTRKQAYKESCKLTRIQKLDDPVKSLMEKQRADGPIGKKIIGKLIFDDEIFIVGLFTDCMINSIVNFSVIAQ